VNEVIRKAVIPAAGLGTRLLPATKEQPKEMLPILVKETDGKEYLKPFLQVVFEQLYEAGIKELCFIVGRGKRSIEDHFTVDEDFIDYLNIKNRASFSQILKEFYGKVQKSTITFVNQPRPLGFAEAVSHAKFFTGNEDFVVHAGDDTIITKENYIQRLVSHFTSLKADAIFYVQRVRNPKNYGVIVGREIKNGVYHVKKVVEKPQAPPSKYAIVAIYIFKPLIYNAIELTKPDSNNEVQLTDAIQVLIDKRDAVYALEMGQGERRIEIGDPVSYKDAFTAKIRED
jgi:UTP--glucose-1-phosphate uridylyltransferase